MLRYNRCRGLGDHPRGSLYLLSLSLPAQSRRPHDPPATRSSAAGTRIPRVARACPRNRRRPTELAPAAGTGPGLPGGAPVSASPGRLHVGPCSDLAFKLKAGPGPAEPLRFGGRGAVLGPALDDTRSTIPSSVYQVSESEVSSSENFEKSESLTQARTDSELEPS